MSHKVIIIDNMDIKYTRKVGESILYVLQNNGVDHDIACGGNGICGKCKIKIIEGEIPITPEDKSFFSKEELQEGYRLSCRAVPVGDCTIDCRTAAKDTFEVVANYAKKVEVTNVHEIEKPYVIAIDIGTTTLATVLFDKRSGKNIQVHTCMNRQRNYGADVISRIQASREGNGEELQRLLREDLRKAIKHVMEHSGVVQEEISNISIACNTTMSHLLFNYSCETLGVYPFTPIDITKKTLSFPEVFGSRDYPFSVFILPGISTFVGADIVAGMLCLDFIKSKKISVLIDLGTNGEMAIGNQENILVTSTAAGPAFEGGNLSCGIGSIAGAICDVKIQGDSTKITTIGNKAPIGICGTGVISTVAELIEHEIIDETGCLNDEHFDNGYYISTNENAEPIRLTQKDIREIQLAKSAVRAGLETLIIRYGINYEEIDTVYLAGGFGFKIDLGQAVKIGLLPGELTAKIRVVGNSSLQGAIEAVTRKDATKQLDRICAIAKEVDLSSDIEFQRLYTEHMLF